MHQITHIVFNGRKTPKGIVAECNRIAKREGEYHTGCSPIRFPSIEFDSEEEARKWVEQSDRGWYDNIAVRFKDGKQKKWFVKIEYHV